MRLARNLTKDDLLVKRLEVLSHMQTCAERSNPTDPECVYSGSYSEWANDLKRIDQRLAKS